MSRGYWFLKGFKFLLLFILYIALLGWVVMELWNIFVPGITGWEELTYTNSLLLLLLVKLLVGFRPHHHRGGYYYKHKFRDKWSNLSEEEREALRQKFKNRWCRRED